MRFVNGSVPMFSIRAHVSCIRVYTSSTESFALTVAAAAAARRRLVLTMMGWGGRYTYVTSYFMKEGNEREAFKDRQNLFSAAVDRISVRIYIYIRLRRLLDI